MVLFGKFKIARLRKKLAEVTALLQTPKVQKNAVLTKKLSDTQSVLSSKITALEQSGKKAA